MRRKREEIIIQPKKTGSFKFLFVTFFALIAMTVLFAIGSASEGAKLLSLEKEISRKQAENKNLQEKVVSETSLLKISEKAEEYDLSETQNVIYTNLSAISSGYQEPVASLP